jgi:hypothetical protein
MSPFLTLGMATFDDHAGVAFTIQALRLFHPEVLPHLELLVVDNQPDSASGAQNRAFVKQVQERMLARYIPAPEVVGTSAPRDRIFAEASGAAVLVCDCHVLFTPGSLARLIAYYQDDPDSLDLLSGPLLRDDLEVLGTHFDPVWRDQMYGVWGRAWRSPVDGSLWSCAHQDLEGLVQPIRLGEGLPTHASQVPGLPRLAYAGHEEVLPQHGWRCIADEQEPVEIPGMGLGAFACRKAAWPGFHPRARGFGGEELYIHEKIRRAGGRNLFVPWLGWWHFFGRQRVPYPLSAWTRARNYVLEWTELGWPLEPIRAAFPAGVIAEEHWQQLVGDPANPPESPLSVQPAAACCNGQAAPAPVPTEPAPLATLEQLAQLAARTPSDINEHVPTLTQLASEADVVVEFGVRHGVSTVALLAGQPKRFVTYDLQRDERLAAMLRTVAGDTDFEFRQGDSRNVEIEECDLLFIDTLHHADQLWAELWRHAPRTKRRICLHDTEIYGEQGDNGGPGLLPALRKYVRLHPEWSVIRHDSNNHGLTVLSRDPADKPDLPSTATQVWNYARALARMAAAKVQGHELLVTEDQAGQRLDVCALCPLRNGERCSKCGCYLVEWPDGTAKAGQPGKAMLTTEDCPLARWPLPLAEVKEAA